MPLLVSRIETNDNAWMVENSIILTFSRTAASCS